MIMTSTEFETMIKTEIASQRGLGEDGWIEGQRQ